MHSHQFCSILKEWVNLLPMTCHNIKSSAYGRELLVSDFVIEPVPCSYGTRRANPSNFSMAADLLNICRHNHFQKACRVVQKSSIRLSSVNLADIMVPAKRDLCEEEKQFVIL